MREREGEILGARCAGVRDEINNEVSDKGNSFWYSQHLLLGIYLRLARLTQLVFWKLKIFTGKLFLFRFSLLCLRLRSGVKWGCLAVVVANGLVNKNWFDFRWNVQSVSDSTREGRAENPTTHLSPQRFVLHPHRCQSFQFPHSDRWAKVLNWKATQFSVRESFAPRFTFRLFINFAAHHVEKLFPPVYSPNEVLWLIIWLPDLSTAMTMWRGKTFHRDSLID